MQSVNRFLDELYGINESNENKNLEILPKIQGWNSTKIKELKEWYDRYANDKDGSFEELCKMISGNSKIGAIGKKFPNLHHGLEYINMINKKDDEINFAYLNAGDLDTGTILRNPINGKIVFASISDIIEKLEKKGYEQI